MKLLDYETVSFKTSLKILQKQGKFVRNGAHHTLTILNSNFQRICLREPYIVQHKFEERQSVKSESDQIRKQFLQFSI